MFPIMPPMSTIKSLAGTGCTCGVQCKCPGCIEHRTPQHASKDRADCRDGCGTCVDHSAGIELPTLASGSETNSIMDRFFARAAALPQPPPNRKIGLYLDPMNLSLYSAPTASANRPGDPERLAFGFVNLPKLKCCSGQSTCSRDHCSARNTAVGNVQVVMNGGLPASDLEISVNPDTTNPRI